MPVKIWRRLTAPVVRSSVAPGATRYTPAGMTGGHAGRAGDRHGPGADVNGPAEIIKAVAEAATWQTPVPADLRNVPKLLKTPTSKSASPCRSYRPLATLLTVPSGPTKKTPKPPSCKLPMSVCVTVPALLNKPLKNLTSLPAREIEFALVRPVEPPAMMPPVHWNSPGGKLKVAPASPTSKTPAGTRIVPAPEPV